MNSILFDYTNPGSVVARSNDYVHTDISLSFIHPKTKSLILSKDIDAIFNSVKNIVLTPLGTRPFFPEFGTRIGNLLFESATATTAIIIENEIKSAITRWEKRIRELNVQVRDMLDNNAYAVNITFVPLYGGLVELQFVLNRTR